MRYIKQYLISIFILALSISATGQNTTVATGGNINNENGSISYSIGQIIVTTNNGNNGSISHGVQQPFEISEITGVYSNNEVNIDINIYPNPTINDLHINIKDNNLLSENTFVHLYNEQGRMLKNQKISESNFAINMDAYSSGTYILCIIQIPESLSPQIIKAFKIIKK